MAVRAVHEASDITEGSCCPWNEQRYRMALTLLCNLPEEPSKPIPAHLHEMVISQRPY